MKLLRLLVLKDFHVTQGKYPPTSELKVDAKVINSLHLTHGVAPFRYGPSFQYAGDYTDEKDFDAFKRRKTRVIAIDALPNPGSTQYKPERLLR